MKLILGAGPTRYDGWQDTDVGSHWSPNRLDVRVASDFERWPSIKMALAEHVWEHLTLEEGRVAARNCYQHVPRLRVAVPDGLFPDEEYRRRAILGEREGDHKSLYDYRSLSAVFTDAGYTVRLLEWWNEQGLFSYRPWDLALGMVVRSLRFDRRNKSGELKYTSLILDAERD